MRNPSNDDSDTDNGLKLDQDEFNLVIDGISNCQLIY